MYGATSFQVTFRRSPAGVLCKIINTWTHKVCRIARTFSFICWGFRIMGQCLTYNSVSSLSRSLSLSLSSSSIGYAASEMLRGRTPSPMLRWQRGGSMFTATLNTRPNYPSSSPLPFRCMSPLSFSLFFFSLLYLPRRGGWGNAPSRSCANGAISGPGDNEAAGREDTCLSMRAPGP